MKRLIFLVCLCAACGISLHAITSEEWRCVGEVEMSEADFRGEMSDNTYGYTMVKVKVLDRVVATESAEPLKLVVEVTEAGTLAAVIGDQLKEIDEITVSGPINDDDFSTLWLASFEGRLKVVDLTGTQIAGGVVPSGAFYHNDAQLDPVTHVLKVLPLEKLYLPDDVTELGSAMVFNCIHLSEIKLPASLKRIGNLAFSWCKSLADECLTLPEGLEEISLNAFFQTRSLSEVVFPASLKKIESEAFYYSGISKVTFNGPVEFIGRMAFRSCNLGELILPDGCGFDETIGGQFCDNRSLTKAVLPADLAVIPDNMFFGCLSLAEIKLPDNLADVGEQAFANTAIPNLNLPEGLTTIRLHAFSDCWNLSTASLPSTLTSVNAYAFNGCSKLKSIISNIENPTPENSIYNSSLTDAVVYIPTGTKQLYQDTEGWKQFVNYVEITDGMLQYKSFDADINMAENSLTAANFTFFDMVSVVDGGVIQLWDRDMMTVVKEVPAYINPLVNCFMVSADFGDVALNPAKNYVVIMPEGTVTDAIGHKFVNSRIVVSVNAVSGIEAVKATDSVNVITSGGFVTVEGARDYADVMVVTVDGRVIARTVAPAGNASIQLPAGLYIMVIDGTARRVVVR